MTTSQPLEGPASPEHHVPGARVETTGAESTEAETTGADGTGVDRAEAQSTGVGRLAATVERLRGEILAAQAAADGRPDRAGQGRADRAAAVSGPAAAARQLASLAREAGVSQLELAADIVNQSSQDHLTELASGFASLANSDPPADADEPSVGVRLRTAESGALAAGDTQAAAQSLLAHALSPLGACAVAVRSAGRPTRPWPWRATRASPRARPSAGATYPPACPPSPAGR